MPMTVIEKQETFLMVEMKAMDVEAAIFAAARGAISASCKYDASFKPFMETDGYGGYRVYFRKEKAGR